MENLLESGLIDFDFPTAAPSILKVLGVGGGGGNAVKQMYNENIRDVNFVLCNTDSQALMDNTIPVKLQLGPGLGSGGDPEIARTLAEGSIDAIKQVLSDETEMVFITAGMGGGTGTGASPVVARTAKDMGILTIGIITIPFMFEGAPRIIQAIKGVEEIKKNVDALLIINNERIRDIYSNLSLPEAFKRADDTLSIAVRSISEIITVPGYINRDFADVKRILKDGGVAIMSNGLGEGENRISKAIEHALHSPLLNNNDVYKAKKILLNITFSGSQPMMIEEINEIDAFKAKFNSNVQVYWGTALDESLESQVKVSLLASGFSTENIVSETESDKEEEPKNEGIKAWEKEVEEAKERERINYEANVMKEYYGEGILGDMSRLSSRPLPFIFTLGSIDEIDDDNTIEAVINNPAFNRNPQVMLDIAIKADARRRGMGEEAE